MSDWRNKVLHLCSKLILNATSLSSRLLSPRRTPLQLTLL